MKLLKKALTLNCLLVLFVITGCTTIDIPYKNACLPQAILIKENLQKNGIWARVVTFKWLDKNNRQRGHAYCLYEYPKSSGQIWSYDAEFGSIVSSFSKKQTLQTLYEANYHRKLFGQIVEHSIYD